jgi:hypothetical protein
MRGLLLAAGLTIGGCYHPEPLPPLPPQPIGRTHVPYTAIPPTLQPQPQLTPLVAARSDSFAAILRSPVARRRELRGLLADADALLATDDVRALPPIFREVEILLRPYPDIKSEVDELVNAPLLYDRVKPIERPRVKRRMEELIDLIRLQVMSAG